MFLMTLTLKHQSKYMICSILPWVLGSKKDTEMWIWINSCKTSFIIFSTNYLTWLHLLLIWRNLCCVHERVLAYQLFFKKVIIMVSPSEMLRMYWAIKLWVDMACVRIGRKERAKWVKMVGCVCGQWSIIIWFNLRWHSILLWTI